MSITVNCLGTSAWASPWKGCLTTARMRVNGFYIPGVGPIWISCLKALLPAPLPAAPLHGAQFLRPNLCSPHSVFTGPGRLPAPGLGPGPTPGDGPTPDLRTPVQDRGPHTAGPHHGLDTIQAIVDPGPTEVHIYIQDPDPGPPTTGGPGMTATRNTSTRG
uniref:Peroxisome proliferator-activated receptor gamma coactivator 1 alpha n=1 Tax=Acipenser sinensis TaxID=61970 RepID=A0A6C0WVZ9_ACISI|nr:peroxisome proliferator-activated receptor gamma coactivator 1 alpha [Acipenser sinensis]